MINIWKKTSKDICFFQLFIFLGGFWKNISTAARNSNNCLKTITFCARFWPSSKSGVLEKGKRAEDNIIQPATAIETQGKGSLRTWYLGAKTYFSVSPPYTNQSFHKQQVQQFPLKDLVIFLCCLYERKLISGAATKIKTNNQYRYELKINQIYIWHEYSFSQWRISNMYFI